MLELDNITLRLGGRELLAGLSLRLAAPATYSLSGPAGSGKSLLCRVACGIQRPNGGTASLFGRNLYPRLGVFGGPVYYSLAQDAQLSEGTLRGGCAGTMRRAGGTAAEAALAAEQAAGLVGCAPHADLAALSPGQQLACEALLAAALPLPLVVLDGHFNLLDEPLAYRTLGAIRQLRAGKNGILLLSGLHDLSGSYTGFEPLRLAGGLPVSAVDIERESDGAA